uniref:AT03573p n=1 Tax=Drosophila melanogaster TaxID=7227 RepID=Q7JY62_DROME|eukprot:NP_001163102.1 lectin-46Cb [Drosophila melanogaster]
MKHLLTALVALLSILPRGELLGSGPPCPRRYLRRINGKCYYFSVKKMNWFGALNNCLRKGLTLADLSNQRDFDGAIGFLSGLGNTEDFWFGGNDLYHEGRFQYISNGRLVRYYSNYSNVLPLEHSECDDCLEVRIRSEINMVSADNCHERQYFICSERYCQGTDSGKKPKHHSHEHLHHFHHDIGGSAEGEDDGDGDGDHDRQDPIASGSVEHPEPDSEDAVGALDVPDDDQPGQNGVSVTPGAEETNTVGGTGEPGATATPAAGAEAVSPAAEGAAPAGAAPAAEGAATPAADGATPAPTPAPGAEAPAAAAAETPAPPAA